MNLRFQISKVGVAFHEELFDEDLSRIRDREIR